MRPTYLSVDIDYFDMDKTPQNGLRLFRKLFILGVPLTIVEDHDGLLEFAKESGATKLINVDYHSDFANYKNDERMEDEIPNCGTWVDFIDGLQEFEWRYPSHNKCFRQREGRCEPFTRFNTRFWTTGQALRGQRVSHTQGIKYLPYRAIVAAGVAVSPEYWNNEEVEQAIFDFLKSNSKRFKYVEPCVRNAWKEAA